METKFQLKDKINANKALSFADKAILNQIISFTNNGGICIATNSYFAECWGVDEQVIKRTLKTLREFGLISSRMERKKHTEGEKNWWNKRYLTVNHQILTLFLDVEVKPTPTEITNNISSETHSNTDFIIHSFIEDAPFAVPVKKTSQNIVDDNVTVSSYELLPLLGYTVDDTLAIMSKMNCSKGTLKQYHTVFTDMHKNSKYNDYTGPKVDNDIIARLKEKFLELTYETAY